ncbi:MAG TPA: DUF859 family phage minor structural protein [Candidatus Lumbricidophila sp.]|nr:DUF859 family phage minor structural protein [Candidatus Lumbricidophila sp.]
MRGTLGTYNATLPAGGQNYTLQLVTSEGTANVASNSSPVNWTLTILKGGGSGKWAGGGHSWSVVIDGQGYSGSLSAYDFRNYTSLQLAAGTTNVTHAADGSKVNMSVSGSFNDNDANGELGDGTASGVMTLAVIPRATTPTFTSPATMGAAMTINLPRASSSFTHTVQFIAKNASGTSVTTTIGTNQGTSTAWTPATATFAPYVPAATQLVGTIRVITYNGSTQIGTKDVSLTLNVPSSVVPTFTTITNSEATSGIATAIGKYVQNVSTLNLAITGAAGASGSTITSYKLTVAGQTINAVSGTTAVISASGTVPIVGTITDSRGRTASQTVNVTVLAYTPPTITTLDAVRALSSGTPDDNGTYIRVNLNASVASLVNSTEKNAITYKVYSRLRGSSTWTLKSTTTPGGRTFNNYSLISTYAVTSAWEIRVEVSDVPGKVTAANDTVSTAFVLVDLNGSLGVGIGQYHQNGMLDVLGRVFQNNGNEVVSVPIGGGMPWFSTSLPVTQGGEVWRFPDGAAISRVTYAKLYAIWGTTFGAGDGSTTFNMPNKKGRVGVGYDSSQTEFNAMGKTGGEKTHVLTDNEMPVHTHVQNAHSHTIPNEDGQPPRRGAGASAGRLAGVTYASYTDVSVSTSPTTATNQNAGGDQPHNNLQPYFTENYVIRIA